MKYTNGKLGRIFVMKFENKDIVVKEIESLARKEKIRSAVVLFIGGMLEGHIVSGPKKPVIPPEAQWNKFRDGWDAMGIATIFSGEKGPQVHVHSAMGRGRQALSGCVRKESSVFCVLEAVLFELKGVKAVKDIDPATCLNMLRIMV